MTQPDQMTGDIAAIPGITLRDYFAGQALVATLVAMAMGKHDVFPPKSQEVGAALDSYAVADAMLAVRGGGAA